MHYRLEYPSGEEFSFAEGMTRGYAAYLEEDYFKTICALYDADPERRKRYRHKIVQIAQKYRCHQEGMIVSVCFYVSENEHRYSFAFTWDKSGSIIMKPRDFGVKRGRIARIKSIFFDGVCLHIFSKKGKLVEKVTINDRFV